MFYTEAERKIYTAPNGATYDPLAVQRRLRIASRGEINAAILEWTGEDELQSAVAEENLVKFARMAFQFEAFEDGGPTDAIVLETLTHFTDYLKNSESVDAMPPTSVPSTECHN